MAMKLEVVITHDEATNKCSIEWSTASTKMSQSKNSKHFHQCKSVIATTGAPYKYSYYSLSDMSQRGKTNA